MAGRVQRTPPRPCWTSPPPATSGWCFSESERWTPTSWLWLSVTRGSSIPSWREGWGSTLFHIFRCLKWWLNSTQRSFIGMTMSHTQCCQSSLYNSKTFNNHVNNNMQFKYLSLKYNCIQIYCKNTKLSHLFAIEAFYCYIFESDE